MKEIKDENGKTIGVQISIFDLQKDQKATDIGVDTSNSEDKSADIRIRLNTEPVKSAVEELMEVIMKHNLLTSCDDEGNIVIHLGDLITDNIEVI